MANEGRTIDRTDPEFRDDSTEARTLPLLPVRDTVLFPHAVLPLTVGRESSVQLINSLGEDKTIVVVAQREARVDAPQPTDLYTIGSLAVVHKVVKMPNQSLFVFAEGLERVRVTEYTQLTPFMRATVDTVPEAFPPKSSEIEALQRNVLTLFQQIVSGSPTLSDELSTVAMNIEEPGRLVDFVASSLPSLSTRDKQEILETADVQIRLDKINQHLAKELEVQQLRNKIQSEVQDRVQQTQREYYLREQLKAI
jgi:ATP-dependent Lon protease